MISPISAHQPGAGYGNGWARVGEPDPTRIVSEAAFAPTTSQDIQMLTLARFRLGRVLLHLLAMLGDRCVRFHVAGIIRDLGCTGTNAPCPNT